MKHIKKFEAFINEARRPKFDLLSAIEGSEEDGYAKIKRVLKPTDDFDFEELYAKGKYTWETKSIGTITCTFTDGNVWTVRCETENGSGESTTYDKDSYGFGMICMDALRELLSDVRSYYTRDALMYVS
jgi:hypothetical protein